MLMSEIYKSLEPISNHPNGFSKESQEEQDKRFKLEVWERAQFLAKDIARGNYAREVTAEQVRNALKRQGMWYSGLWLGGVFRGGDEWENTGKEVRSTERRAHGKKYVVWRLKSSPFAGEVETNEQGEWFKFSERMYVAMKRLLSGEEENSSRRLCKKAMADYEKFRQKVLKGLKG